MTDFQRFIFIPWSTIINKEITRFVRIWPQTLLPPAITMSLYFLIFGHFIGSQLSDIHGVSYTQFIAPGLIMMAVITNSFGNVVASFFSARMMHYIEEVLISPTPNWVMLLGYVSGGIVRGLLVGGLVTLIALFFTHLKMYSWSITLLTILLTSLLFSLAGFTNALFAKKFDDISIFPTFVLTPMTYLAGVFYSINALPKFWQVISHVNPILYMVNNFRYGILGISDTPVLPGFLIIIGSVITLSILNLVLLKKGVGLKS